MPRKRANKGMAKGKRGDSPARIFERRDYDHLTANGNERLRRAVERGKFLRDHLLEPTLELKRAMFEVLLLFIKERRRVVYGGFAINAWIASRDPSAAFYDESEVPDIEFYSSDAVLDARDLADIYHNEMQLPWVRVTEAFHPDTFRVSANLVHVCDITYVARNVRIPSLTHRIRVPNATVDGIRLAIPRFLLIDCLRIISDPVESYWRLEKAFPRMYDLQRLFHFEVSPLEAPKPDPQAEDIVRVALETLEKHPSVAVVVGRAALRRYAAATGFPEVEAAAGLLPLEIIATDFEASLGAIFQSIRDLVGDSQHDRHAEYIEARGVMDYCGRRGHVVWKGRPVIRVFDSNDRCVPVIEKEGSLRTGSFALTACFMLIGYFIDGVTNLPFPQPYSAMLYTLFKLRKRYMASNKESLDGIHALREFSDICVGKHVSVERRHKLEVDIRRSNKGAYPIPFFVYDPATRTRDPVPHYRYMNRSGNVVVSEQDQLFRLSKGAVEDKGAATTISNKDPGGSA